MLAHGFGIHVPEWFSPAATFVIVGYFLLLSWRRSRQFQEQADDILL